MMIHMQRAPEAQRLKDGSASLNRPSKNVVVKAVIRSLKSFQLPDVFIASHLGGGRQSQEPSQLQRVTEFFVPLCRLVDQIRQFAFHIVMLRVDQVGFNLTIPTRVMSRVWASDLPFLSPKTVVSTAKAIITTITPIIIAVQKQEPRC
jgi:hypothetical protein